MAVAAAALLAGAGAVGVVLAIVMWRVRREAACRELWPGLTGARLVTQLPVTGAAALLAAVAALAFSAGRPPEVSGRTPVVVVFDVSLSMMATDIAPTRQTAAVAAIDAVLSSTVGPAGLVVFADDAVAVAPLTVDVAAVTTALAEVVATGFRPGVGSVPGRALNRALEMLAATPARTGVVLLVSDGEWTESAGLDEALTTAVRLEVPIVTLGVGTTEGALVGDATGDEPRHRSRLNHAALIDLATRTGGRDVTGDARVLSSVLETTVSGATADTAFGAPTVGLVVAFVLLLVNPLRALIGASRPARAHTRVLPPALAMLLVVSCGGADLADANRRLDAGDDAAAAAAFDLVRARGGRAQGVASFNLGVALSRLERWEAAEAAFADSVSQLPARHQRALAEFGRGVSLAQRGRLPASASAFIAALTLDPDLDVARINLTIVRARLANQGSQARGAAPPAPAPRYRLPAPPRQSRPASPW